jgi:hypothetical protein
LQAANKREKRLENPETHPSGAKQAAEKGHISGRVPEKRTSGAKALGDSIGFMPGIDPQPTARRGFSAACKAHVDFGFVAARLRSCPDTNQHFSEAFWAVPVTSLPAHIGALPTQVSQAKTMKRGLYV